MSLRVMPLRILRNRKCTCRLVESEGLDAKGTKLVKRMILCFDVLPLGPNPPPAPSLPLSVFPCVAGIYILNCILADGRGGGGRGGTKKATAKKWWSSTDLFPLLCLHTSYAIFNI